MIKNLAKSDALSQPPFWEKCTGVAIVNFGELLALAVPACFLSDLCIHEIDLYSERLYFTGPPKKVLKCSIAIGDFSLYKIA